jgi:predicted Zn finger-like uncharacterized protein
MDVRCEKCNTEYELDEERLKPGGVTVKCTGCGHMFKVRRRNPTNVGVTSPRPRRPSTSQPPPAPGLRPRRASSQGGAGKTWLVRSEGGDIKTCTELATLQQWIVSGVVGPDAEISRTGNTWKPLGDIPELAKFFEVADEARRARQSTPPPARVPAATPAPPRRAPSASEPEAMPAASQPVATAQPDPQPQRLSAQPPGATASAAQPAGASARATGAWATARSPRPPTDGGPSGPTGGIARGIPTHDVAFAGGGRKLEPADAGGPGPGGVFAPTDAAADDDDDLFIAPRRGGIGKWIALVSVLVMAGAAAVVFLFVFDSGGSKVAAGQGDAGVEAAVGAGDAGAATAVIPAEMLAAAEAAVRADTRAELERIATQLAEQGGEGLDEILAHGRIEAALAQDLTDQAAAADDTDQAKALARAAQERVLEAANLARRASGLDPDSAAAEVLMADVLRMQGKSSREIERHLRKAPADDFEARLVRALTYARDNKPRQARDLFGELTGPAEATGDVRPRYRLALLALEADDAETARREADAVLAIAPDHAGAARVLERLRAAEEVASADPMPPETGSGDSAGGGSSGGSGGGSSSSGSAGAAGYDGLLARADKLAENGDCRAAMGHYEKALDANPIGVAALTGMGYCHLDQREFASAHRKFKAALGISSRYQPALYGIAEAYQQQGLKDQAIEAFRTYLDEHPSGTRAEMARRQIERLGGSTTGGDSPAGGSGASPGGGSGASPGGGGEAPGAGDDPADSAEPAGDPPPADFGGDPAAGEE